MNKPALVILKSQLLSCLIIDVECMKRQRDVPMDSTAHALEGMSGLMNQTHTTRQL